ncbi:hypothetical protein Ancab_001064 [Ancistrocladus abbreviatus]
MALKCSRFINRTSVFSLQSAFKSTAAPSTSAPKFAASSSSTSPLLLRSNSFPLRRFSFSRPPSELGCVQSLLPLHSTVATARMTSCLSTTSRSCRSLSQEQLEKVRVGDLVGFRSKSTAVPEDNLSEPNHTKQEAEIPESEDTEEQVVLHCEMGKNNLSKEKSEEAQESDSLPINYS